MITYDTQEERKFLEGLADMALKTGGIQNLAVVNTFLAGLKQTEKPKVEARDESR